MPLSIFIFSSSNWGQSNGALSCNKVSENGEINLDNIEPESCVLLTQKDDERCEVIVSCEGMLESIVIITDSPRLSDSLIQNVLSLWGSAPLTKIIPKISRLCVNFCSIYLKCQTLLV